VFLDNFINDFFKPLTKESLQKAVNIISAVLKEYT